MELVVKAEELIQVWEDELGPLKRVRADLYGPGGRLEGVRKITNGKKESLYEKDDVRVDVLLRATRSCISGVEVGMVSFCGRPISLL